MDKQKMADKLRALRGAKSQAEVARDLGIPATTYNSYELGERIPRDDLKVRIANYYSRSVKYIFFE